MQQGIQAATAAIQGLAGGDMKAALAGGAAPYLAEVVKNMTTNADGSVNVAANAMVHAVVGAVVAQLTDFRFHDLRHTWASWLVQAGVPLSALQEMGGWESIEMVRRYAHLSPNHLTEHARKIDEVMGINVTNLALLKKVADN